MADGQVDELEINELKSLNCFGVFSNLDNAYYDDDDDDLHTDTQAQAYFQRNVDVGGSLRLGVETSVTDADTEEVTYTNLGGEILVRIEGATYILTPQKIAYLTSITSDIQDQLASYVTTNNIWTGTNAFNTTRPTSTLTAALALDNFITKRDADALYIVKTTNNIWTGTNAFNTPRPTSTLTTALTLNNFITKRDADALYAGLSNNNTWTGTNAFNTTRPTSSLITTPALNNFITKRDADTLYGGSGGTTLTAVQINNNTWTGTNEFNTTRPTSSLITTPALNNFITNGMQILYMVVRVEQL